MPRFSFSTQYGVVSMVVVFAVALLALPIVFGQTTPSVVTPSATVGTLTHEKAVLAVTFTTNNCTAATVKVDYATSQYYSANNQQYNQSTTELAVSNLTQTFSPHVSNLNANTTYEYRVGAKCTAPAAGEYTYSANASLTTTVTPQPPAAPTLVNITSSSAAPYVLTVTWKQSQLNTTTDTQYYFSYTAGTAYSKSVPHDSTVASSTDRTTTLDYNLESGKTYTVELKACNGTSLCSSAVSKTATVGPTFTVGADGLLGHWKFDGNGNNEVPAGQIAQLVGSAIFKPDGGKLGGYLYIPGSSDYAKIPYRSEFDLPQSFTVEFWFRQRSNQSFNQELVYKGTPQNNYNFKIFRYLWNQYNNGAVIAGHTTVNTGYWTQASNPNEPPHGSWHHVVYTKSSTAQAYYIDGVLIHSKDFTQYPEYGGSAKTPAVDIIIGDTAVDTDIDNLRIYNKALSIDEVISNGGFPPRVQVCTANTKQCSGSELKQCSSDGFSFTNTQYCSYGCDSTTLSCKAAPQQSTSSGYGYGGTTSLCTLTTDKTTYTTTENVNYTYTCSTAAVTRAEVRVVKPDGSITSYNTAVGSPGTQRMGFGTSDLVAGTHTLQLCVNDVTCAAPSIVSVPFTITSDANASPTPTPTTTTTPSAPRIDVLDPATGPIGTVVTVKGAGFTITGNAVNFGSGYLPNLSSFDNGTKLTFTVPQYLELACAYAAPRCLAPALPTTAGQHMVSVKNANGTSSSVPFLVLSTTTTTTTSGTDTTTTTITTTSTTTTGHISGFVKSDDGPVKKILMKLFGSGRSWEVVTDENGYFFFGGLGAGKYKIEVLNTAERGYTPSNHPEIDLREGGQHTVTIGIGRLAVPSETPPSGSESLLCPMVLDEVCGEYRGQLVTYGNTCELKRSGAVYRAHGRCQKIPDVSQKICPQFYAPVCGKDGRTYPNSCIAEGVTGIAWNGTCERAPEGTTQGGETGESTKLFERAKFALRITEERFLPLEKAAAAIREAAARDRLREFREELTANATRLREALSANDANRMRDLSATTEELVRRIDREFEKFTSRYTTDFLKQEAEATRELSKNYTTTIGQQNDIGFFGDDPIYLRTKIEKKKAILRSAEEALAHGDKRLAEKLFNEAREVLGSAEHVYTTPTDAQRVDLQGITRLLVEVRSGLTATWEGVDRLKREGIESDTNLIAILQKAETLFEDASKALEAGDKEAVSRLLSSMKQLGLNEKFGNFRGGTGRAVMTKERVEDFLREIERKRQHLERGREELARRGAKTDSLESTRVRLEALLAKAKEALASGDEKLLVQLLDELRSIDIEAVLSQLFKGLGEKDFIDEITKPLNDAPQYIAAMGKVIQELRDSGKDVAFHDRLLAATEAARVKGQTALASGDTKAARDVVHAMFESGMRLYELLGQKNVDRYLSREERKIVTGTLTVDPTALASVELLGESAKNEIAKLVNKSTTSAAERFAITATLSEVPADIVVQMLDARKRYTKELQKLMGHVADLPPAMRATMLENKVELLGELANFDAARKSASQVKGITRAALEQIDALKKKLADFNFPPEVGALIVKRVETFVDTVRSGAITDPQELGAYVATFQKEVAIFFREAQDEKYRQGITPAKNIDDTSALYAPAIVLREAGALAPLLTKSGEVKIDAVIDGATYEKLLEAAVDENVFKGAGAQRLKRSKVVRGSDAIRYLLTAYDVKAPSNVLQNNTRLAKFVKKEFSVALTPRELGAPLTRGKAITLVGGVEEKLGIAEE